MAANMLPIIALGAAALFLMKKKGNGGGNGVCPEGQTQTGTKRDGTIICGVCPPGETHTGTKRDGTIICGPFVTKTSPVTPKPSGGPKGLATLDLDVPLPGPTDPYEGQPWTSWPQPVQVELAGYTCSIGHVLVYRGVLPDGTIGGSAGEGVTWCVPPWGAVLRPSGGQCDPGLTDVKVIYNDTLRHACRNIPST